MKLRHFGYLAVVLFAVLLSAWPYLEMWKTTGDPTWLADNDEHGLYLATAAQAYHHGWLANADSVFAGEHPTAFPWAQIMPGTLLARAAGLGPFGISLVWRLLAGLTTALAWLFFFRFALRLSVGATIFSAVVLLGDINGFFGKLFAKHFVVFGRAVFLGPDAAFYGAGTNLHAEWRLITPGLSLWFLLLFFAFFLRARETGSKYFLIAAAAMLGLLFHVYFYFWTFILLGLALSIAYDVINGQKREALGSIATGALGVLFGLPALWASFAIKRAYGDDWLKRSDKFLPIARTSELLIPFGSILLLALLFWIDARNGAKRRLPLIFIAGGFLLLNHQLVTGLQIENFHWGYAIGPLLAAFSLVVVHDLLLKTGFKFRPPVVAALTGVAILHAGAALWLRHIETSRLPDSLPLMAAYRDFVRQGTKLPLDTVVGGDRRFAEMSAVANGTRIVSGYAAVLSPAMKDAELDERIALDGFLGGQDEAAFRADQESAIARNGWGPEAREPNGRERRLAERVAAYARVASKWEEFAERFGVRAVAIPVVQMAPEALQANPRWSQTVAGPVWNIWQRNEVAE